MFARSAATDTLQGQAIQAVNAKWGDPHYLGVGRESIGFPVCKKKYAPFRIVGGNSRSASVQIERMYGCACHSHLRKAVIEKHGERDGWEPFGQWSLQKAKEVVRQSLENSNTNSTEPEGDTATCSSSSDPETNTGSSSHNSETRTVKCFNGSCVWKVKSAYDDVYLELNGHTVSDAEDEK